MIVEKDFVDVKSYVEERSVGYNCEERKREFLKGHFLYGALGAGDCVTFWVRFLGG